MKTQQKLGYALLVAAVLVTSASAAPLIAGHAPAGDTFTAAGPACCRYSNECPGSETCGSTTGCSAGAPYHCEGGSIEFQ